MRVTKAEREFISGMKNIEEEIINKLKAKSIILAPSNFQWNEGRDLFPLPSKIMLEVNLNDKKIKAYLSQDQLEDSWDLISRPDVKNIVKHILLSLA